MRNFILVMFSIPLFQGVLNAQTPWTRNKAGFYVQTSWQSTPLYQTVFDASAPGNRRTLERAIRENSFQLLAEYGLSDKTTIWSATPFRFQYSGKSTGISTIPMLQQGRLNGLGNITLACRHRFSSGKVTITGQARLDFDSGKSSRITGLNSAYDAWSGSATLSIGQRSHTSGYWFVYGGAGWRGPLANSIVLGGGEAGLKFRQFFLAVMSDLSWRVGTKTYEVEAANKKTALYAPDQSVWLLGGKAGFEMNRFYGFYLGAVVPQAGNQAARQTSFLASMYFKWD
ncbi:MAG: hypothetical protein JNM22_15230 [Saprospiraceae bacterium]|nr:hypothetical protein [Saprospiraceae bacterium]